MFATSQAQPAAWADTPDTTKVDSAVLVIGDIVVGEFSYYVVTDSTGVRTRFVVFPAEVSAVYATALHKAQVDNSGSIPSNFIRWRDKFLQANDTKKK